jgi:hypothetical protein
MTVGNDDLTRLDAWWADLTPTEQLAVRSADGHTREGWVRSIIERSGYPWSQRGHHSSRETRSSAGCFRTRSRRTS